MKKMGLVFILTLLACIFSLSANSAERAGQKRGFDNHVKIGAEKCTGPLEVHIFPEQLEESDILTDGPDGTVIEVENYTMLIWIDREPGKKFAHSTEYVLVSSSGIKVVEGMLWPELNGRRILYDEPNDTPVVSPFYVRPGVSHGDDHIDVYSYPYILKESDKLVDGLGAEIDIDGNTFLIWVNMYPNARFSHETAYILINDAGVRVVEGAWAPELNGKTILFGRNNLLLVHSPTFVPEN